MGKVCGSFNYEAFKPCPLIPSALPASPLQVNRECGVYNSAYDENWQSLSCESALPYICKKMPNDTRRAEPLGKHRRCRPHLLSSFSNFWCELSGFLSSSWLFLWQRTGSTSIPNVMMAGGPTMVSVIACCQTVKPEAGRCPLKPAALKAQTSPASILCQSWRCCFFSSLMVKITQLHTIVGEMYLSVIKNCFFCM